MTRAIHVVRSLRPETGGLAEAVQQLAAAQRERGDVATIVSLDPADRVLDGVVCVGCRSHGYGFSPEYVPWLRAHSSDFDVVIVHGLWQFQAFGAWRALHGGLRPYIVYPHGMLDVWFKRAHPLKHAKKWLYWPWADYRVLRDAAVVCFTAEEERRRAQQSFWLYRARETIAPIGIRTPVAKGDADRNAWHAAYPQLCGKSYILFLGRIHPKKGIDLLLRAYAAAFAGATQPLLVIAGPVGDDRYYGALRELASKLAIEARICWIPMIFGSVKWGALRMCEAFVLLSHQENFGVAVVEALACSRPVLVSRQVAISAEIEKAGAGLVAADTVEDAIALLTRWRELPNSRRIAMRQAAQDLFRSQFEIQRAADVLASVIAGVKTRVANP